MTATRWPRSSRSSTPAAGNPSGPSRYYRRAAEVAAGVFAHAEAIRLHARRAGDRPRARRRARPRPAASSRSCEAMAAPLNALERLRVAGLQRGARAVDRSRRVARPQRTRRSRPGRAVVVAVRAGPDRRRGTGRRPGRSPSSTPGSEMSGAAHFAFGGVCGQPRACRQRRCDHFDMAASWSRPAPRSASAPGPTCTAAPGRRTRTGCWATTTVAWPAAHDGDRAGPGASITRTASRWRWPTRVITHQLRARPGAAAPHGRRAARALRPVRLRATTASGALVLDGWCPRRRAGHRAGPARHRQPAGRRAPSPACRTGCRCSPTCSDDR